MRSAVTASPSVGLIYNRINGSTAQNLTSESVNSSSPDNAITYLPPACEKFSVIRIPRLKHKTIKRTDDRTGWDGIR